MTRRTLLQLPAAALAQNKVLYENPLARESDVADFRMEGQAKVFFVNGRMRMQNALDPALGQASNFVYWCPREFPDDVEISFEFRPIQEPGLCILFFAAKGIGKDLFDPLLPRRTGEYKQYHSGAINALHVSYFRRLAAEARAFHLCNLRKSKGFHLVTQGADPIPSVPDVQAPFRIAVLKKGPLVRFSINELVLFEWTDDGNRYGPVLTGGRIGFRQMAPLLGEYANLKVREAE
jgi:hypothetical protein